MKRVKYWKKINKDPYTYLLTLSKSDLEHY